MPRDTNDAEDERLRAESLEIEHLLGDIEALVTPPAWQRIERVIARIIRLYGAGLERALEHARSANVQEPAFDELLAGDELLASLLVLHGIHPLSVEERVNRALVVVRRELGLAEADLVLAGVRDGRVELQAIDALGGGAMAARVAEGAIRRVIESVAPEVTGIEIRGAARPARDPKLVQLRIRREAP